MKKETVITAAVFLVLGFLLGYMFEVAQVATRGTQNSPLATTGSGAGAPAAGSASDAAPQGLPPGHPPINNLALIENLRQQATANPTDPGPLLQLANLFYDQGQFQTAIDWYEKALAIDPKNINARTDLGTCYFNIGQPAKAMEAFQQSLAVDPNHQPTLFNMIVVSLQGTHDLKAARRAWDRLHQLNPNYQGLDDLKQRLDSAAAAK